MVKYNFSWWNPNFPCIFPHVFMVKSQVWRTTGGELTVPGSLCQGNHTWRFNGLWHLQAQTSVLRLPGQIMAIHCGSTGWCWFQGEESSGSWSQWKIGNSQILQSTKQLWILWYVWANPIFPSPCSWHRPSWAGQLTKHGSGISGVQRPVETQAKPRWPPKIPCIFHGNYPMQMTIWRYYTLFNQTHFCPQLHHETLTFHGPFCSVMSTSSVSAVHESLYSKSSTPLMSLVMFNEPFLAPVWPKGCRIPRAGNGWTPVYIYVYIYNYIFIYIVIYNTPTHIYIYIIFLSYKKNSPVF